LFQVAQITEDSDKHSKSQTIIPQPSGWHDNKGN